PTRRSSDLGLCASARPATQHERADRPDAGISLAGRQGDPMTEPTQDDAPPPVEAPVPAAIPADAPAPSDAPAPAAPPAPTTHGRPMVIIAAIIVTALLALGLWLSYRPAPDQLQ